MRRTAGIIIPVYQEQGIARLTHKHEHGSEVVYSERSLHYEQYLSLQHNCRRSPMIAQDLRDDHLNDPSMATWLASPLRLNNVGVQRIQHLRRNQSRPPIAISHLSRQAPTSHRLHMSHTLRQQPQQPGSKSRTTSNPKDSEPVEVPKVSFRDLGATRTVKIVIIVAICIAGTAETVTYSLWIWRYFYPPKEKANSEVAEYVEGK